MRPDIRDWLYEFWTEDSIFNICNCIDMEIHGLLYMKKHAPSSCRILILIKFAIAHYKDVTWPPWRLKSPVIRLFLHRPKQSYTKERRHWIITDPLRWEFTRNLWILCTKEFGKCFRSTMSSQRCMWAIGCRKKKHWGEWPAHGSQCCWQWIKRETFPI